MKILSRIQIENIAKRVIEGYKKLPELKGQPYYKVDPKLLVTKLLKLNVDYARLSLSGDILGLTSFGDVGVPIYDETDDESYYMLDGKTILIDSDLKKDITKQGRHNFSLMHEGAHQIYKMIFPNDYGIPSRERHPIHFYRLNSEKKKPISDWEEWQANVITSALLLPAEIVEHGMFMFGLGEKIQILNKVYCRTTYDRFSDLAIFLGVSKQALAIRMKHLGLLEIDHLDNPYQILDIHREIV